MLEFVKAGLTFVEWYKHISKYHSHDGGKKSYVGSVNYGQY